MSKKPITFAKLLTRKHPKLMRKWHEEGGGDYKIIVEGGIEDPASVTVRLVFKSGRIENIDLPLD
jgi:hypothetical protein